jgi:hypothetical protein
VTLYETALAMSDTTFWAIAFFGILAHRDRAVTPHTLTWRAYTDAP